MSKRGNKKSGKTSNKNKAKAASTSNPEAQKAFPSGQLSLAGQYALLCIVGIALFLLTMFQGGYFFQAPSVIGILAIAAFAIMAIALHFKPKICFTTICLLMICVCCGVGTLMNGHVLSQIQETLKWAILAGLSVVCIMPTRQAIQKLRDVIAGLGVFMAVIAIGAFFGAFPIEGAVQNGRLAFTFQYSNTAGIFFAVLALLCMASRNIILKWCSLLSIIALALTQSVGAIGLFFLAMIAWIICVIVQNPEKRKGAVIALAAIVVIAAVICLVFSGRIELIPQTFERRFAQIGDGIGLLAGSAGNILLGIGPDSWEYALPAVQSAPYAINIMDCGYLQLAMDGGVFALCAFVVMLALGFCGLARSRDLVGILCVALMCVHGLFDFDFAFMAIMFLLVILITLSCEESRERLYLRKNKAGKKKGKLSNNEKNADMKTDAAEKGAEKVTQKTAEEAADAKGGSSECAARGKTSKKPIVRTIFAWATLALTLISCGIGCYLAYQVSALESAVASSQESQEQAVQDFTNQPGFIKRDPWLVERLTDVAIAHGNYPTAVILMNQLDLDTGQRAIRKATALYGLTLSDQAAQELLDAVKKHPYNQDLYEAAKKLFESDQNLTTFLPDLEHARAGN